MYELPFTLILIATPAFAFCWFLVHEIVATFRPLRSRAVELKTLFFATAAFCLILALLRSEFFSFHFRGIVVFLIPVWVIMGVLLQIFLEDFRFQTRGLIATWDWRRISLDGPTIFFTALGGLVGWVLVAELSWPLSLVAALVLVPLFSGMGIVGRFFWEDSSNLKRSTTTYRGQGDQPTFSPEMRIPPKQPAKSKARLRPSQAPRSRGSPVDSAGARFNPNP